MSNPRVMAAMSDDNILPDIQQEELKTEVLCIHSVFAAAWVLIVFWAKTFDAPQFHHLSDFSNGAIRCRNIHSQAKGKGNR